MNGIDNTPLISIIINCYNGEEYLRQAIDSVFSQTYTNWEIIFWDNCSTDGSAEIAKSYGEKIKYYLATENKPLGEARNYALEKAKGEYLCFIDCDDIWIEDLLKKQVDLMEANKDFILSYGSIEEIHTNGSHFRNVITSYKSGFLFKELLLQFDINILTTMLRVSLLRKTGLTFDSNITASEEYCLFMQLASQYKIGVLKDVLAKYRVHPNSLTSKSLLTLGKERKYTLDKIIGTNPVLLEKYKKEFKEAYARANYYDSRWYMSKKEHVKAFKKLLPIAFVNPRYLILMFMTLLPSYVWNHVHIKRRNRT